MRNNYVADRGDYYKYGLLKFLSQNDHRLGIIWYLYPDSEPGFDAHGSDTDYLTNPRYQPCDPSLLTVLQQITDKPQAERCVQDIQTSDIFPPQTVFFDDPLSFQDQTSAIARRQHREAWFKRALAATQDCSVVFLDPDTGLEVQSVKPYGAKTGPKYVSDDEIRQLHERDQTLVIYQHTRRESPQTTSTWAREKLQTLCKRPVEIPVYYFKGGSGRMFFILPSEAHQAAILASLNQYEASLWQGFFEKL